MKYIPDFLLPKYKTQILDEIILNESTIGYIVGNNLKDMDLSKEEELKSFTERIRKLEVKDISNIYIEGCHKFSWETLKEIEGQTGLNFASGHKIRVHNIEILIREIAKLLNRGLDKSDLLIICKNKSRLIDIIRTLPNNLNCIASLGIDEDNLYEEVLKKTGIAIYQPYKIHRAIRNFHIIINFEEERYFDIARVSNQVIILDLSNDKPLKAINKLNNIICIEDFIFPSKLESRWIDHYIDSRLYESIYHEEVEKFIKVYTQGNNWHLEEYVNEKIKKRGRL